MSDKTEIARWALANIGSTQSITDLSSDRSTQANQIRLLLPGAIKTILEAHPWRFAKGVVQSVPLVEEAPLTGWRFAYAFPHDALVIRSLHCSEGPIDHRDPYPEDVVPFEEVSVGGAQQIHTNFENPRVVYTRNVEENDFFPTHVARAIAAQLSLDVAPSLITANYAKVKNDLISNMNNVISAQMANDINKAPESLNYESPYVRARNGG